ncbi:hypothetical protein AGABI1DRAFT_95506 [Agaricus bisporus var. burnettii JB137-S8]|uniref:Uncharacterized protein n=1 Tax=Agaricus bisporus var. burnettii (strain JB137-S8 / ATCC MYA-4627 / FGSC 10392) TaxID=597362 RepID=K5VJW6_AGABU|nr:uncharacterized protein AGABI1DRAFT_95506 [Agaricus bisporus var. burnettii JB137-S8]EKM74614.1 hypothetical protein AGABI1DRAFT_95506 [Agaricus bisporus var. burnettii JB137-S8]
MEATRSSSGSFKRGEGYFALRNIQDSSSGLTNSTFATRIDPSLDGLVPMQFDEIPVLKKKNPPHTVKNQSPRTLSKTESNSSLSSLTSLELDVEVAKDNFQPASSRVDLPGLKPLNVKPATSSTPYKDCHKIRLYNGKPDQYRYYYRVGKRIETPPKAPHDSSIQEKALFVCDVVKYDNGRVNCLERQVWINNGKKKVNWVFAQGANAVQQFDGRQEKIAGPSRGQHPKMPSLITPRVEQEISYLAQSMESKSTSRPWMSRHIESTYVLHREDTHPRVLLSKFRQDLLLRLVATLSPVVTYSKLLFLSRKISFPVGTTPFYCWSIAIHEVRSGIKSMPNTKRATFDRSRSSPSELQPQGGREDLESLVAHLVEAKISSIIAQYDRQSHERIDKMEASWRAEIEGCRQSVADQAVILHKCIDYNESHQQALEGYHAEVDDQVALIKGDIGKLHNMQEKLHDKLSKWSKDVEALEDMTGRIQDDIQSSAKRLHSFEKQTKFFGEQVQSLEGRITSFDALREINVPSLEIVESLSRDIAQLHRFCENLKVQLEAFSPSIEEGSDASCANSSVAEIDNAIRRDGPTWTSKFLVWRAFNIEWCIPVYQTLFPAGNIQSISVVVVKLLLMKDDGVPERRRQRAFNPLRWLREAGSNVVNHSTAPASKVNSSREVDAQDAANTRLGHATKRDPLFLPEGTPGPSLENPQIEVKMDVEDVPGGNFSVPPTSTSSFSRASSTPSDVTVRPLVPATLSSPGQIGSPPESDDGIDIMDQIEERDQMDADEDSREAENDADSTQLMEVTETSDEMSSQREIPTISSILHFDTIACVPQKRGHPEGLTDEQRALKKLNCETQVGVSDPLAESSTADCPRLDLKTVSKHFRPTLSERDSPSHPVPRKNRREMLRFGIGGKQSFWDYTPATEAEVPHLAENQGKVTNEEVKKNTKMLENDMTQGERKGKELEERAEGTRQEMRQNEGESDVWECSINSTVEDLMGGGDEVSGGAATGGDYDIEDVAEKEAREGMEQGPKGIDSNEEMSECDDGSEGVVEN